MGKLDLKQVVEPYTEDEIIRLCYDYLEPAYRHLKPSSSKRDLVTQLINYANKVSRQDELSDIFTGQTPANDTEKPSSNLGDIPATKFVTAKRGIWLLLPALAVLQGLLGNVVADFLGPWFADRAWFAIGLFTFVIVFGIYLNWLQDQLQYKKSSSISILKKIGHLWKDGSFPSRMLMVLVPVASFVSLGMGWLVKYEAEPIDCPIEQKCVIIAEFTSPDGQNTALFVKEVEVELRNALLKEFENGVVARRVPAIKDRHQAKQLLQNKNNLIVVWGELLGKKVSINIELTDQLDVQLIHEIDPFRNTPLLYPAFAELRSNSEDLPLKMAQYTAVLTYLANGMAAYASNPKQASELFAAALFCASEEIDEILIPNLRPWCEPVKLDAGWNLGLLYYYMGQSLHQIGDYKRASTYLEAAMMKNPRDPAAKAMMGVALNDWADPSGTIQLSSALELLREAEELAEDITISPVGESEKALAYYQLGLIQELVGNYNGAESSYEEAIKRFEKQQLNAYIALVGLARAQRKNGDVQEASQTLNRVLKQAPDVHWGYLEMAYLVSADPVAANDYLNRAAKITHNLSYIDLTRGELCLGREDYNCAVEAYQAVDNWLAEGKSESTKFYVKLGDFYRPSKSMQSYQSWAVAETHYRQALQLSPHNPWIHYRLAFVLFNQENYENAVEHYQQTIELVSAESKYLGVLRCDLSRAQAKIAGTESASDSNLGCEDLTTNNEKQNLASHR